MKLLSADGASHDRLEIDFHSFAHAGCNLTMRVQRLRPWFPF
jgi:hypothetical protein